MPNVCTAGGGRRAGPAGRSASASGSGPGNPDALLTALGTRDDWEDLQVGGALCLNLYDVFTKPGVSTAAASSVRRSGSTISMGHRVELVPGGFRQMGPIMARFAPRVMVAQARAARRQRHRQPLAAPGRRPGTSSCAPAGTPTGCSSWRSTRNLPRTKSLPPDLRQHHSARRHRRARRVRRRTLRARRSASEADERGRGHCRATH